MSYVISYATVTLTLTLTPPSSDHSQRDHNHHRPYEKRHNTTDKLHRDAVLQTMPHSQHHFPSSLPIIQRIKPDAQLEPHTATKYLDESLAILGGSLVTKNDFIASQELQDKGICEEFKQQRNYMDGRFEQQRNYMDGRFEQQRNYMDGRFEKIDKRFEKVDETFEEMRNYMDGRFADVDRQFEEMRARQLNSMCTRAHDRVHPIAKIERSAQSLYVFLMPKYFPVNVGKFWGLKSPDCVGKLTYLVQFYDVEGYEDWEKDDGNYTMDDSGLTDDSSQRDCSSLSEVSLEDAVQRYPDKALRALAMKLGLVYREVTRCMEEIEDRQQLQALVAEKRTRGLEDPGRPPKLAKTAVYNQPRRSPSYVKLLVMTLSEEKRNRAEESKRSESERVYWEDTDALEARARIVASMMSSKHAREELLEMVEQLSKSERSELKHSRVKQPIAEQSAKGSTTVPNTPSSRKSSKGRGSQASEGRESVARARSSEAESSPIDE